MTSRGSGGRAGESSCCDAAVQSRRHGIWRWPMHRVLYVFLPSWPIDRLRRSFLLPGLKPGAPPAEGPFATVIATAGRQLLAAVNPAAAAKGLAPGLPLADALSF